MSAGLFLTCLAKFFACRLYDLLVAAYLFDEQAATMAVKIKKQAIRTFIVFAGKDKVEPFIK